MILKKFIQNWLFCLLIFSFASKAQQLNPSKISFVVESGLSLNPSSTALTESSGSRKFRYSQPSFRAYTWSLGAEIKKSKLLYGLKLKRVALGNHTLFHLKLDSTSSDFTLFRKISKNNLAAVLSFGYEFEFKNLVLCPRVAIEYLFLPELNSYTEAYVSLNTKDTAFIYTSSTSNNSFALLTNLSLSAGYRFNSRKKYPFIVSYVISYSHSTNSMYSTNTSFVLGKNTERLSNTNKGIHFCHQLSISYPLQRIKS